MGRWNVVAFSMAVTSVTGCTPSMAAARGSTFLPKLLAGITHAV